MNKMLGVSQKQTGSATLVASLEDARINKIKRFISQSRNTSESDDFTFVRQFLSCWTNFFHF